MWNADANLKNYFIDLSSEAMIAWKPTGEIISWNKSAESEYGYSYEEAVGEIKHQMLERLSEAVMKDVYAKLEEVGTWRGECVHTRKDGTTFIVESRKQMIIEPSGRRIVLETNRNITEYREANEALSHLNNKLSLALESFGAGVWESDFTTGKQIWSPKLFEIFGVEPFEYISHEKPFEFFHSEDREYIRNSINDAIKSQKESWQLEHRIINPKRGIVWIRATAKVLYDPAGNILKMVGINVDITRQKQEQDRLVEAEIEKNNFLKKAIEMKDEFISLISHEFKTPLAIINAAVETMMLVCNKELSDKATGFLEKILQNSNRQVKLVNNLLDINRINSGLLNTVKRNTDVIGLTKNITKSVAVLVAKKNISLSFCSSLDQKVIGIDEEKYERVLLNLLSNAVKYSSEGKSITVSIGQKRVKGKRMVCINVTDQGRGIPQNKQAVIFEKFEQVDDLFSRQAEGTGIGLYLVKLLVELMEGQILLKNNRDMGCTFTVLLPDKKVKMTKQEEVFAQKLGRRLVKSSAIEFSDIYFK